MKVHVSEKLVLTARFTQVDPDTGEVTVITVSEVPVWTLADNPVATIRPAADGLTAEIIPNGTETGLIGTVTLSGTTFEPSTADDIEVISDVVTRSEIIQGPVLPKDGARRSKRG